MSQTNSIRQKTPAQPAPLPPGPRGHFLLGVLPEFRRDQLALYQDTRREFGDVVRLRFAATNTYAVSHPDHIKHILQDNNRNYRRNPFLNDIVKLLVGISLFTADGDDWLSRRRLMQPAFHRQHLGKFGTLMTAATHEMLERWQAGPNGQMLQIEQEMTQLTLRVAGQALFSKDLTGESSALGDAFTEVSAHMNYRMGQPFAPPAFVPTGQNRRFKQALKVLDNTIYAMIHARRAAPNEHQDLLAMLMEARDADTGEAMNDEQVRNEIAVMMFAGHETTAVTLTWVFYLLSEHPEVEGKLHAELATVLGGRMPEMADLPKLPFNRMVIEEALRMYPPAIGVTRQSINDDEIGGYRIPAKAGVTVLINNVHRDERFWDDPERFDPERFTPERAKDRPHFAYLPFGGGPRQCIGNLFALTEAQLLLASIAQRFSLRLKPGHPVKPTPVFVLRTSHGLPMTARQR